MMEKNVYRPSIWVGVFLLLAGVLTLAEQVGLIPPDFKWGGTLFLCVAGVAVIVENLRR